MKKVCGTDTAHPCYRCIDRWAGDGRSCHSTCERYMKIYRRNVEVICPARQRYGEAMSYTVDETYKSMKRGERV